MKSFTTYLSPLVQALQFHQIKLSPGKHGFVLEKNSKKLSVRVMDDNMGVDPKPGQLLLPLDYLVREPEKIASGLLSKMGSNKKVFARQCELKKISKQEASEFLDRFHVMNSTQSAFNLGLYFGHDLLAVASFSKGRRMNRLPEQTRSFELIRFCCKSGYTVTGGLSKLVRAFSEEKKAGDVMTYVDRQWSDGRSFAKAGFVLLGKGSPNYFLVNRKSFERTFCKLVPAEFDERKYYLTRDSGNLKMVFHRNENA